MDRLRRSLRSSLRRKKDRSGGAGGGGGGGGGSETDGGPAHRTGGGDPGKPALWEADEVAVRSGTCSFQVKVRKETTNPKLYYYLYQGRRGRWLAMHNLLLGLDSRPQEEECSCALERKWMMMIAQYVYGSFLHLFCMPFVLSLYGHHRRQQQSHSMAANSASALVFSILAASKSSSPVGCKCARKQCEC